MNLDAIGDIFKGVWDFLLFILASILFLPALLIVNILQSYWTKKLSELFGV